MADPMCPPSTSWMGGRSTPSSNRGVQPRECFAWHWVFARLRSLARSEERADRGVPGRIGSCIPEGVSAFLRSHIRCSPGGALGGKATRRRKVAASRRLPTRPLKRFGQHGDHESIIRPANAASFRVAWSASVPSRKRIGRILRRTFR